MALVATLKTLLFSHTSYKLYSNALYGKHAYIYAIQKYAEEEVSVCEY